MKILDFKLNHKVISLHDFEGTDEEYNILLKWHTDKTLLEFYHGRDKIFIMKKLRRIYNKMRLITDVYPSMIKLNDIFIGYVQYYKLQRSGEYSMEGYQVEYSDNSYAIDLFIGETGYWSKGIGSILLHNLAEYLCSQLDAQNIYIDPKTDNARAIKAYIKAGFVKIKILKNHEVFEGKQSDSWLMKYEGNQIKLKKKLS